MREMHREPEVPGEEAPVEECFDCLARITSKELASTHSVSSGTLQNACSTRRVTADLGKGALMRIARLKNSLAKGQKNGDKSAMAILKKNEYYQRTGRLVLDAYSPKYTTIGLRISGYGAAEVFIDFAAELKHTETDPTCKIHESRCTSC